MKARPASCSISYTYYDLFLREIHRCAPHFVYSSVFQLRDNEWLHDISFESSGQIVNRYTANFTDPEAVANQNGSLWLERKKSGFTINTGWLEYSAQGLLHHHSVPGSRDPQQLETVLTEWITAAKRFCKPEFFLERFMESTLRVTTVGENRTRHLFTFPDSYLPTVLAAAANSDLLTVDRRLKPEIIAQLKKIS